MVAARVTWSRSGRPWGGTSRSVRGIVTLTAFAVAGAVRRRGGSGLPSGYAKASPVTSRQVANRVCGSVW
jgi:hypothetical protein